MLITFGVNRTIRARAVQKDNLMSLAETMNCPGFEQFKHLQPFTCKCPNCGKEREIFSDEFDRKHICNGCGKDETACPLC